MEQTGANGNPTHSAGAYWRNDSREKADIRLSANGAWLDVGLPGERGFALSLKVRDLLPAIKDMWRLDEDGAARRTVARVEEALARLRKDSREMSETGGELDLGTTSYSDGHYVGLHKGIDKAIAEIDKALVEVAALPQKDGSGVMAKERHGDGKAHEMRRLRSGRWVGERNIASDDADLLRRFEITAILD